VIQLQQVSKRYAGGQDALRDVTLHIEAGEMVFLTGHSGAGKSTLLRLVTLIERSTRGIITVGGQPLGSVRGPAIARYRRNLGMVFQDHRLLMDRPAFDNVALPLVIAGYARQEVARRTRAALDRVGLLAKERMLPQMLSSGEQQRVGIARAVVHKPAVLLADEPTGNLDPELSRETMRLFERFNEVGVTVVIASHDLSLIGKLGHRVVSLDQGKVIADGDTLKDASS
jgi:cell division transport system ATP-binding protein